MKYVSLGAVYLIWGSTYFAVKIFVEGGGVSPLQLQFARVVCAAALLAVVAAVVEGARAIRRRPRPSRAIPWKSVAAAAISGALMWAAGNGFATYSAPHASSSFIVMAMGTIPLWSIVVEAFATSRLPSRRTLVGLGVGLVGLGAVVAPGVLSAAIVDTNYAASTAVMLAAAGLTWAAGTAIQKRTAGSFAPSTLAALQFSGAALVLAGPVLASSGGVEASFGESQVIAFGYLVVFGSAISLSAYAMVVRRFSPPIASTFAYVNPVVGIILGALLLDESIQLLSVFGLALVLAAVFWIVRNSARDTSVDLRSHP